MNMSEIPASAVTKELIDRILDINPEEGTFIRIDNKNIPAERLIALYKTGVLPKA
jgi:hypothetical protein